jgi:hypothetical protein
MTTENRHRPQSCTSSVYVDSQDCNRSIVMSYTLYAGVNYANGESKNLDEFTGSIADIAMHAVMVMSDEVTATGFTFTVKVNQTEVIAAK